MEGEAEATPFGDRVTLDDGVSVYLPPTPSARASRWAKALREATPEQFPRLVQALIDNEHARIIRLVEEAFHGNDAS